MKINFKNKVGRFAVIGGLAITAVSMSACNSGGDSTQANTVNNDLKASAAGFNQLDQSQPVHTYNWSQLRQTLQDIEDAQAHTTQTTSFFFNQGVTDPIMTCPSIGFPIASTTQITNPDQIVQKWDGSNNQFPTIPLGDPTGVYSGNSTGTYVLCVSPNGSTYANYWEGFVQTVSGPAVWDSTTHSVKLTGPSSANFKTRK